MTAFERAKSDIDKAVAIARELPSQFDQAISHAVADERERCARIAEAAIRAFGGQIVISGKVTPEMIQASVTYVGDRIREGA